MKDDPRAADGTALRRKLEDNSIPPNAIGPPCCTRTSRCAQRHARGARRVTIEWRSRNYGRSVRTRSGPADTMSAGPLRWSRTATA